MSAQLEFVITVPLPGDERDEQIVKLLTMLMHWSLVSHDTPMGAVEISAEDGIWKATFGGESPASRETMKAIAAVLGNIKDDEELLPSLRFTFAGSTMSASGYSSRRTPGQMLRRTRRRPSLPDPWGTFKEKYHPTVALFQFKVGIEALETFDGYMVTTTVVG